MLNLYKIEISGKKKKKKIPTHMTML